MGGGPGERERGVSWRGRLGKGEGLALAPLKLHIHHTGYPVHTTLGAQSTPLLQCLRWMTSHKGMGIGSRDGLIGYVPFNDMPVSRLCKSSSF